MKKTREEWNMRRERTSPRDKYLILALGDKDKETCHARAKIS